VALAAALLPATTASGATTSQLGQRYEIAATLDVAAGRLDATMTLHLTNEAPFAIDHVDLGVVPRALGFLTMAETLTVDGAPVEGAWTTSINLEVPLGELRPGATAEVAMSFRLDVGRRRRPTPTPPSGPSAA
jgi:hypothetical protein